MFAQISGLIEAYPWNNFLQLKVYNIYEEIFENQGPEFRTKVLEKSGITDSLIRMGAGNQFEHTSSERKIRHGYMALVTKLGNLIQKHKEKEDINRFITSLPNQDSWTQFIDGELKRSNETNNKNLGGQQPRTSMDDDDDSKDYEMNMEKIMYKFTNFSSSMADRSNNSEENDDDDDDEDEVQRQEDEQEERDHNK